MFRMVTGWFWFLQKKNALLYFGIFFKGEMIFNKHSAYKCVFYVQLSIDHSININTLFFRLPKFFSVVNFTNHIFLNIHQPRLGVGIELSKFLGYSHLKFHNFTNIVAFSFLMRFKQSHNIVRQFFTLLEASLVKSNSHYTGHIFIFAYRCLYLHNIKLTQNNKKTQKYKIKEKIHLYSK